MIEIAERGQKLLRDHREQKQKQESDGVTKHDAGKLIR